MVGGQDVLVGNVLQPALGQTLLDVRVLVVVGHWVADRVVVVAQVDGRLRWVQA